MLDPKKLEELAKQIADAVPPGVKNMAEGAESRVKTVLQSQLSKLDLVTREEFNIQSQVLIRTREMKERVAQTLGKPEARGLKVSTFHTLGLNIIKSHVKDLGLKPGFSLFDDKDSISLLTDLTADTLDGDKDQLKLLQSCISNWKNDLILPDMPPLIL